MQVVETTWVSRPTNTRTTFLAPDETWSLDPRDVLVWRGASSGPQGWADLERCFLWTIPLQCIVHKSRDSDGTPKTCARLSSQLLARFQHLRVAAVPGRVLPCNSRICRERDSPAPEKSSGAATPPSHPSLLIFSVRQTQSLFKAHNLIRV